MYFECEFDIICCIREFCLSNIVLIFDWNKKNEKKIINRRISTVRNRYCEWFKILFGGKKNQPENYR